METNLKFIAKKDLVLSMAAGFLIGLLALPVLKAAKPDIYDKFSLALIPLFFIATPIGLVAAYYISQKISLVWQLAKFGIIGAMNTLVDLGVLAYLVFGSREFFSVQPEDEIISTALLAISFYTIYKAFSFIIANANSYLWNKYWTFEQKNTQRKGMEFTSFIIVSIIGFIINVVVASIIFKSIAHSTGLSSDQGGLIGGLAGTVAGLGWNFLGYKFIVFKK